MAAPDTAPDPALVDVPIPPTAVDLGLMQGFPPAPDARVTHETMLRAPWNRWTPQHTRELLPSARIARGAGPVREFERRPVDLSGITFTGPDGGTYDLEGMLRVRALDAMVVLHDGALVYEDYRNGMSADALHIMFSVTKSFVGTLALQAKHEALLHPDAPVAVYVPELARGAWGTARVQQTLDMTTALDFDEAYAELDTHFARYLVAAGFLTPPAGYAGARHLTALFEEIQQAPERDHGHAFTYITSNTDVAAWVLARVTGQPFHDLCSTRIWSQIGAEHDAYVLVDPIGTPFAGGGLNATARDVARFGQLILDGGAWNGQQVLAPEVVEDILTPGDPEVFARGREDDPADWLRGGSYRNFWWYSANEHRTFTGIGIHGQFLYIDPEARMVAVLQSSHPEATNPDVSRITARGLHAIATYLMVQ